MASKKTPIADAARSMTKLARLAAAKKVPTAIEVAGKSLIDTIDKVTKASTKSPVMKAPTKARSGTAKRAELVPAKKVATATSPTPARKTRMTNKQIEKIANPTRKMVDGKSVALHSVATIEDLRKVLLNYAPTSTYYTDTRYGSSVIFVRNNRGRLVAEITNDK